MAAPAVIGAAGSAASGIGAGAGAGAGSVAGAGAGAAAVSGGMSIFSSILNNAVNWKLQQEQRGLTREANATNERLMREAWARDDTARQRMVLDLEAAGLSKWLATGASPMSSSPISVGTPDQTYKANFDFGAGMDKALAAYQAIQYAYQTEMQTKNLIAQHTNIIEQNRLLAQQIREASANAGIKENDYKIFTERGVASNDPQYIKYLAEAIRSLKAGSKNPNIQKMKEVISEHTPDKVLTEAGDKALKAAGSGGNAVWNAVKHAGQSVAAPFIRSYQKHQEKRNSYR